MQIKNCSLGKNLNTLTQKLLFYESKCSHHCLQLLQYGFKKSGRYFIAPSFNYMKEFYCDQTTDGGSWVTILRNWGEYRNRFGDLDYDFWLGNDFLYKATTFHSLHEKRTWQLHVQITDKSSASSASYFKLLKWNCWILAVSSQQYEVYYKRSR